MREVVGRSTGSVAPGLRFWLRADAVVTGLNGLAYVAAAPLLEGWIGVSVAMQRGLGAFLVVFAVAVALTSPRPGAQAVLGIIAVNAAWVLASAVVAITGGLESTVLGRVWVVAQAIVVGTFAVQQARLRPSAQRVPSA